MMSQEYKRTFSVPCVYVRRFPDDKFIILLLYVDDMLIMGQNADMIQKLKMELSKTFDMKDLGSAKRILGMETLRDRKASESWLSQERYIERMLEMFHRKNSKPFSTPLAGHFKLSKRLYLSMEKEKCKMLVIPYSSAIGSLMYAMVCTYSDISHAIEVVSKFLENPSKAHWEAMKWFFR